jgi:hypothetical protein
MIRLAIVCTESDCFCMFYSLRSLRHVGPLSYLKYLLKYAKLYVVIKFSLVIKRIIAKYMIIFFKKIMRRMVKHNSNCDNNLRMEEVFDFNVLPCAMR